MKRVSLMVLDSNYFVAQLRDFCSQVLVPFCLEVEDEPVCSFDAHACEQAVNESAEHVWFD